MLRLPGSVVYGALLLAACSSEPTEGLPDVGSLRADPSTIVLEVGKSQAVTTEAFLNNEPDLVVWNVGSLGKGLSVVEDTSYGRVYVGEHLVQPVRSHTRRFTVTLLEAVPTSFVISGGTSTLTILVRPTVP
jgi:hypothetical protein